MRTKHILIGTAVVAAMLGLAAFVHYQARPAEDIAGDALMLPGLRQDLPAVAKIALRANDTELTVARVDTGWGLVERDGYPVAFSRIQTLLDALSGAHLVEAKTSRAEAYPRLGLAEPGAEDGATLLSLTLDGASEPAYVVYIGHDASPRTGRYVRLPPSPQSWLIDQDIDVSVTVSDWLDATLLTVDYERVKAFERLDADGSNFAAQRGDGEAGEFVVAALPEGRELRYASILNGAVRALLNVRIEDVRPRGDDLPDEGVTRSHYRTSDGLELQASVWKQDEQAWLQIDALALAGDGPDATSENAAVDDAADDGGASAEGEESEGVPDVAQEAAQLNARLAGWQFRISEYSYGELSKGLAEYLSEPAGDEAGDGR